MKLPAQLKKIIPILTLPSLLLSCTHTPPSEPSEMFFDHTLQITESGEVFKELKKRGFTGEERFVNHPGQLTCEFIHFKKKTQTNQGPYIEFCYHNTALPKDHYDFGKDPRDFWPGYSLRSSSNLEAFFQSKKEEFKEFEPAFEHKNYEWAVDNKSKLPGWNFLNFNHDPIQGIFIWITEYEKRVNQPDSKSKESPQHENQTESMLGMVWSGLSGKDKENLQKITRGTWKGDRLILSDGIWIKFVEANSPLGSQFQNKKYPYVAVVLSTKSLATFEKIAKPDDKVELDGQTAARIKLGSGGWDILVLEDK